jgi:predicted PP-loop superfamily ATPase
MRLQRSINIAATPEKVWPFLVEPEKIMKWFTLLRKFEYTGNKQSGVGAVFHYEEKSGAQSGKVMVFLSGGIDSSSRDSIQRWRTYQVINFDSMLTMFVVTRKK